MVMDRMMARWILGLVASLGTGLMGVSMGISPGVADPPLDLIAGEQSVTALKEDGMLYMQWGFHSLAIDSFRGAMALEDRTNTLPKQRDPDVAYNLGILYFNKGDLKGARRAFERSLEADPTNFQAHYRLGLVELQMGNEEAARQRLSLLETAAASDPEVQEHLQGLMASLDPLPTPQPEIPELTQEAEAEPNSDLEPALNTGPVEAESSTLAADALSVPPAPFNDEVTGVVEFEGATEDPVDMEAEAAETEDPETAPERGLSRFRRED